MMKAYKTGILNHKTEFIWVGLGTFVQLVVGLFTIKLLTRSLGPGQYGMLSLFLSGIQLIETVIFSPLIQGAGRFSFYTSAIQHAYQVITPERKRLFYITCSALLIGSLYFFYKGTIVYGVLTLFCIPMIYFDIRKEFMYALYNADLKRKLITQLRSLEQLLKIILVFILVYFIHATDILSVVGGIYIMSTSALFLILLRKTRDDYPLDNSISFTEGKDLKRKIINFAIPFAFTSIVLWMHTWADRWILNEYLGLKSVGIYTSYVQIAYVPFNILGTLAAGVFAPILFKQVEKVKTLKEFYVFRSKIRYMLFGYMALSLVALVFILVVKTFILNALVPRNYITDGMLLFYISTGAVFASYSQMQTILSLHTSGESRLVLYANIIGVATYLLLTIIFIKKYSVEGVAFAFILSNIIKCILLYLFSIKSWSNLKEKILVNIK